MIGVMSDPWNLFGYLHLWCIFNTLTCTCVHTSYVDIFEIHVGFFWNSMRIKYRIQNDRKDRVKNERYFNNTSNFLIVISTCMQWIHRGNLQLYSKYLWKYQHHLHSWTFQPHHHHFLHKQMLHEPRNSEEKWASQKYK